VFSSETKAFSELAGLEFVTQAAQATTRPWFAIGGITPENLDEVLASGARRVAVGASIMRASRPRDVAATMRQRLDQVPLD
jgi:thiamine-phosphate pyrophosphorylase